MCGGIAGALTWNNEPRDAGQLVSCPHFDGVHSRQSVEKGNVFPEGSLERKNAHCQLAAVLHCNQALPHQQINNSKRCALHNVANDNICAFFTKGTTMRFVCSAHR